MFALRINIFFQKIGSACESDILYVMVCNSVDLWFRVASLLLVISIKSDIFCMD